MRRRDALAGFAPFGAPTEGESTSLIGAGPPVMNLVGMDDDEIAGTAVGPGPAIAERLQPGERDPDRIGVVAVRVEGMAGEESLDPLEAPICSVGELFQGWPDGTTLNKFDTRFFRLDELQE